MAAPGLDVDREQVRMLVLSIGPREAARKMGLNENTVRQWSARYGWLKHARPEKPQLPKSMQPVVVTNVTKPADALLDCIIEDGKATKVAGMKAARRVAERISTMAIDEAVEQMPNLKASLQSAAIAGDWQVRTDGQQLVINIALLGRDLPDGPTYDIPE